MKFAGKAWRLLVGIKDGLVLLLMLLFFGGLYAALSVSPHGDSAYRGALRLDLAGAIVEQPAEQDPLALLGGGSVTREYRLAEILRALEAAESDERVKAIALDLDVFTGGGQTAIATVGAALDDVRRSGKRVVAFANGYGDDGYQLAAHADEIWLDPMGAVVVAGPGGLNLYYAGLLERLGITANVYRVGAFKSAVEPYTRSDMSPEARANAQALADALWESWQDDVSRARPRAQLRPYVQDPMRFLAAANGDMARAALQAGLIDRIGDRAQFGQRMAELTGGGDEKVPGNYPAIHLDAWVDDNPISSPAGEIGILTVAGLLVDGEAALGTAGAETVVSALERGLQSGTMKALVVRIDSPGGSALASERIRRSVMAARRKGIPVVVSLGSVAASGGYWIATVGETIFAEPSTITGSIGVFGVLPSFEQALEKLSVGADGVRTTPLSNEPNIFRGISPEANRMIQSGVETTYRRFLALVSQSRRIPVQRVHQIAQGRVWDGGTARQLGLVDQFGSLEDAVAEAARRAGLDPDQAETVFLEQEPDFFTQVMMGAAQSRVSVTRDVYSRLAMRPEQVAQRVRADIETLLGGSAIQARCLECPTVAPVTARSAESGWLANLLSLVGIA